MIELTGTTEGDYRYDFDEDQRSVITDMHTYAAEGARMLRAERHLPTWQRLTSPAMTIRWRRVSR